MSRLLYDEITINAALDELTKQAGLDPDTLIWSNALAQVIRQWRRAKQYVEAQQEAERIYRRYSKMTDEAEKEKWSRTYRAALDIAEERYHTLERSMEGIAHEE